MKEARSDRKGIRVNGIVTHYADQALFAYLSPMPVESGERMRALKQLAHIGLMTMRGVVAAQSCSLEHTLASEGSMRKPESTTATEGRLESTHPTLEPSQAGAYDLAGVDLGGIDLPF